jgi:Phosphotransferase enzyme family
MANTTKVWAVRRIAGVLVADIRARRRPPPGPSEQPIPISPAGLTPDWLTRVLCPGGTHVTSVRTIRVSVGTTTRLTLGLTYDEGGTPAGLPPRVFVKHTHRLGQRLMLGLGGLIEGEPYFYAHVRPILTIEAPEMYFGSMDERSWRSILVLEDVVQTRGASFWKPGHRFTREQMEDLLSTMARWHGQLWETSRLAAWGWLKSPADLMHVIDALIGLADRTPTGMRRAAHVIPPVLRARRGELRTALRRSMELASQGPHTYLHGDLHAANTYMTREGNVGICDWQCGLRGSWAHDYAYAMATALDVEDRRAWEQELLDHYLNRLGEAGGGAIARDEAWLAYRRATLYPYFAWLYTIGRSRLQPHFQPDEVSLTMLKRIGAAIDDLDSLAAVGV